MIVATAMLCGVVGIGACVSRCACALRVAARVAVLNENEKEKTYGGRHMAGTVGVRVSLVILHAQPRAVITNSKAPKRNYELHTRHKA